MTQIEDDKKIKGLTMVYKFARAAAFGFSLVSLYVVNNMGDGEPFDVHQQVSETIAREAKDIPEIRKVALTADLNDAADKAEEDVLTSAAQGSLSLGLIMLYYYKAMNNAIKEKDGPKVG